MKWIRDAAERNGDPDPTGDEEDRLYSDVWAYRWRIAALVAAVASTAGRPFPPACELPLPPAEGVAAEERQEAARLMSLPGEELGVNQAKKEEVPRPDHYNNPQAARRARPLLRLGCNLHLEDLRRQQRELRGLTCRSKNSESFGSPGTQPRRTARPGTLERPCGGAPTAVGGKDWQLLFRGWGFWRELTTRLSREPPPEVSAPSHRRHTAGTFLSRDAVFRPCFPQEVAGHQFRLLHLRGPNALGARLGGERRCGLHSNQGRERVPHSRRAAAPLLCVHWKLQKLLPKRVQRSADARPPHMTSQCYRQTRP